MLTTCGGRSATREIWREAEKAAVSSATRSVRCREMAPEGSTTRGQMTLHTEGFAVVEEVLGQLLKSPAAL